MTRQTIKASKTIDRMSAEDLAKVVASTSRAAPGLETRQAMETTSTSVRPPASDPAIADAKPKKASPGRKNSRKGGEAIDQPGTTVPSPPHNSATAGDGSIRMSDTNFRTTHREDSRTIIKENTNQLESGERGGQMPRDNPTGAAASLIDNGDQSVAENRSVAVPEGEAEAHKNRENQASSDLRFADPLVQAIVEQWRQRQDMVRAQTRLTLQAKAICRRFTAGDKDEADKLYAAVAGKGGHPMAEAAAMAIMPLVDAQAPLIEHRTAKDKALAKLAKDLPIAHMADEIRGVNLNTLAAIVGECGDLSAYKSVAAIWKRAGMAVIDGERQRLVAGNPEKAIRHGYSPARRSVFWNIGANLVRSGGKGDDASKYRLLYDEVKAREFEKLEHKGHADNRARRYITKRFLRDLYAAWKAAGRAIKPSDASSRAPAPLNIAAE